MTDQFDKQKYLNLETYRKNSAGVKTPVWFVQDGENLWVWTQDKSGKAGRIRRNSTVKVVPCKAMGEPVGTWVEGTATADASPEARTHLIRLMRQKYGLAFRLFHLSGRLRKEEYTTLRIQLSAQSKL
ncbi:MAG: PPOX class F420-dependent oxidoreductase [Anaerolineales bacterium]|nr:PPOX class F420-dependent oxidoreductase [Anaerolineales bacterium]